MKSSNFLFLFLATIIFAFASCSDDGSSSLERGTLAVSMTDAPFPTDLVVEANVVITKIEVRKKGDDDDDDDSVDVRSSTNEDDDDASFVTIMEGSVELNLLDLRNGITENLVNAEVEAGTYDLVRLHVSQAEVVLSDGSTFNLQTPSAGQSGIKVFVKPSIVVSGGLTSDLLLDFDVSKSFVLTGNLDTPAGITGFIFKPVIKAANVSTTGSLSGTVSGNNNTEVKPLEGVEISVLAADTLNTSTFTDVNGQYTVLGLSAGSYKVIAEAEGYMKSEQDGVIINVANQTNVDFALDTIQ